MDTRTAGGMRSRTSRVDDGVQSRWTAIPVRRRTGDDPSAGASECVYRRATEFGRVNGVARLATSNGEGWEHGDAVPSGASFGASRADWTPLHDPSLLIIDDHTLHRENLAAVFVAGGSGMPASAWDLQSLFAALTDNPPSLVLLNLDTRDSAMLLHATFEICPDSRVIVLGMSEDDEAGIVACAEAGVAGYHLRSESLDDLLALIRKVANGETSCSPRVSAILLRRLCSLATQRPNATQELVLTAREAQILRMLEMGMTNRDIADDLCIAVHTVKNHVHSVLTKLGVSTRAEAAARFRTVRFRESDREN